MSFFAKKWSWFPIVFLIMAVTFFTNCTKETTENFTESSLFIDESLVSYFDQFVEEGAKRGLIIDLTAQKIEGYLIDIEEAGVAGQCSYSATSSHRVNIDKNYWLNASTYEKEMVVFHELGHCYLGRSHDDTKSRTGVCLSIMNSGLSGCRFRYNQVTRSEYLDELFE